MFDEKGYDVTINSPLPKEWFKEAEDATFLGRPFSEYSKEELSAIAAHGWKMLQDLNIKLLEAKKLKCVV
jgi:hypothetical protein